MGAIATRNMRIINDDVVVSQLEIDQGTIDQVTEQQREELRQQLYRGDRKPPQLSGQSVILVDDGIATGSTMRAAIAALRQIGPARIVVAVALQPRTHAVNSALKSMKSYAPKRRWRSLPSASGIGHLDRRRAMRFATLARAA